MKEFDKESIIDKIAQAQQVAEQKLIINDIICIYCGVYPNYSSYMSTKQNEARFAGENNFKKYDSNINDNGALVFTFYPQPTILTQEIFEYITMKAGQELKKESTKNKIIELKKMFKKKCADLNMWNICAGIQSDNCGIERDRFYDGKLEAYREILNELKKD